MCGVGVDGAYRAGLACGRDLASLKELGLRAWSWRQKARGVQFVHMSKIRDVMKSR